MGQNQLDDNSFDRSIYSKVIFDLGLNKKINF